MLLPQLKSKAVNPISVQVREPAEAILPIKYWSGNTQNRSQGHRTRSKVRTWSLSVCSRPGGAGVEGISLIKAP